MSETAGQGEGRRVSVEISEPDALAIKEFLDRNNGAGDFTSHGELSMHKLAAMLLQDVALMVRRPGSWEGSNMAQLISSHGYEP